MLAGDIWHTGGQAGTEGQAILGGHGRHDRLGGRVGEAGWARHRKAMYGKGGMQAKKGKRVGRPRQAHRKRGTQAGMAMQV